MKIILGENERKENEFKKLSLVSFSSFLFPFWTVFIFCSNVFLHSLYRFLRFSFFFFFVKDFLVRKKEKGGNGVKWKAKSTSTISEAGVRLNFPRWRLLITSLGIANNKILPKKRKRMKGFALHCRRLAHYTEYGKAAFIRGVIFSKIERYKRKIRWGLDHVRERIEWKNRAARPFRIVCQ